MRVAGAAAASALGAYWEDDLGCGGLRRGWETARLCPQRGCMEGWMAWWLENTSRVDSPSCRGLRTNKEGGRSESAARAPISSPNAPLLLLTCLRTTSQHQKHHNGESAVGPLRLLLRTLFLHIPRTRRATPRCILREPARTRQPFRKRSNIAKPATPGHHHQAQRAVRSPPPLGPQNTMAAVPPLYQKRPERHPPASTAQWWA